MAPPSVLGDHLQSESPKSVGLQAKSSPPQRGNDTSVASPRRPKSDVRAGNSNKDSPSKISKRPERNASPPRIQSPRQELAPRSSSQTRTVARTAKAVGSSNGTALTAHKVHERSTIRASNTTGFSQRREARPSSNDAGNRRVAALEEENERLHARVEEAERRLGEAWQKMEALEDNCDLWKRRWDQSHDKLEQAWRDHETLQQRWEEKEDLIYAERWARDRDQERLQAAESMLRELGHPLPPATSKRCVKSGGQRQVFSPGSIEKSVDGGYSWNLMSSDPTLLNCVQRGSLPSTSVVQEGPFPPESAHTLSGVEHARNSCFSSSRTPSAAEHARKSLFGSSILEALDPAPHETSFRPRVQSADKEVLESDVGAVQWFMGTRTTM